MWYLGGLDSFLNIARYVYRTIFTRLVPLKSWKILKHTVGYGIVQQQEIKSLIMELITGSKYNTGNIVLDYY